MIDIAEKPYYSRRLRKDEIDTWLSIDSDNNSEASTDLPLTLIELEESMFFISYLGDEIVAGTGIFRDPTRRAMTIPLVRITPDLKSKISVHTLKSSIPFFRSATIREVDVLVKRNSITNGKTLFFDTTLPEWLIHPLQDNKFEEVDTYYRIELTIPNEIVSESKCIHSIKFRDIQNLYWKDPKVQCPDTSNLWLGFRLAEKKGNLVSTSEKLKDALGYITEGKSLAVLGYLASSGFEGGFIEGMTSILGENAISSVTFHFVSTAQLPQIDEFVGRVSAIEKRSEIVLYRRVL